MPDHHLPEDLLMAYAAGIASEPHALLCAVHLTLCASCRDDLALYEELGGALLEVAAPSDEPVQIEELPPASSLADDGALPDGADAWPRPLHPYVRGKRWHWHSPGIHVLTTDLVLAEMPVRLFKLSRASTCRATPTRAWSCRWCSAAGSSISATTSRAATSRAATTRPSTISSSMPTASA